MNDLTEDQRIRLECLNICSGSVSEAKQAYYWVMGEGQAKAKTKPDNFPLRAGVSPEQSLREQVLREHIAMEQMHAGARQNNAVNPYIGEQLPD